MSLLACNKFSYGEIANNVFSKKLKDLVYRTVSLPIMFTKANDRLWTEKDEQQLSLCILFFIDSTTKPTKKANVKSQDQDYNL